jgi:Domain of unknown function (DUF4290)
MNKREALDMMEYNSQKDEVIVPEYGRNVQNMIKVAKAQTDPRVRQVMVDKIVDMMMMMHPQNRNMEDYREKLWKHVFRMAGYDLDVEIPMEHRPTLEEAMRKPDKVPYPQIGKGYRHYGNNVKQLIHKAIEMEDGGKKEGFVGTIASYMKLAYRTWNKEPFVSDHIIKTDLELMSDSRLSIDDETAIENLSPTDLRTSGSNNQNNRRRSTQGSSNNRRSQSGGRSFKSGAGSGGFKRKRK